MAPKLIPNTSQEEWLKVLGKGMVTIPKKGENVVLTSPKAHAVSYRIYTDDEIKTFLKDDRPDVRKSVLPFIGKTCLSEPKTLLHRRVYVKPWYLSKCTIA